MSESETAVERLLATLELHEFGVEMMTAKLRREHPNASQAELDARLDEWLGTQPKTGIEDGYEREVPLDRFR